VLHPLLRVKLEWSNVVGPNQQVLESCREIAPTPIRSLLPGIELVDLQESRVSRGVANIGEDPTHHTCLVSHCYPFKLVLPIDWELHHGATVRDFGMEVMLPRGGACSSHGGVTVFNKQS
jgi:hypothetical protein